MASVVHDWQVAVANRNVGEACSLLDEHGRSMIERELARFIARFHIGSSCADAIGFLHDAVMTPEQRAQFLTAKAGEVSVARNTAKARSSAGGIYWLRKSNAGWRIDEVPLATSK